MPTEDQISTRSHQGLPQEGGVELSLDDLAKGLATGTLSRGKALRWMGGALLGTALASFPGVAWANDCRRLGRECRRDSQCCSRNCVRRGDDKVCACPEGKRRCGDRCVNLKTNENHCGSCFNSCEEGEECVDGECGGGCPSGRVPCATGTCGTCCLEGWECVEGVCTIVCTPSCPEGCNCQLSADGGANVCIASGGAPIVSSCAECPTADFPENTECIKQGGCGAEPFLACARPCPPPGTNLLGCLCNDISGGGNITRFVCRSEDCTTLDDAAQAMICDPLCATAGGFSGDISCQLDSPECGV